MRRSQKSITLLRILFESANKKNKILAVTRATRDVILKKPRISGAENGDGHDCRDFLQEWTIGPLSAHMREIVVGTI